MLQREAERAGRRAVPGAVVSRAGRIVAAGDGVADRGGIARHRRMRAHVQREAETLQQQADQRERGTEAPPRRAAQDRQGRAG